MNNVIGKNIRKYREIKGFSKEYMAHELNINQASYAKLENNSTRITVDRLFLISQLLETDIEELLALNKQTVFNQTNNESANAFGNVEHFYQENKEIQSKFIRTLEEMIADKNEEIRFLKEMLNNNS